MRRGVEYYTASKVDSANYCTRRFFLEYIERVKVSRLSAYARGSLMHELAEHFWDRFGDSNAETKKARKKYTNAEEFSKYAGGKWVCEVMRSERGNNPIAWNSKEEKWIIKSKIQKSALHLFEILSKQPKPIFSEFPFGFYFDGFHWKGRIDEIQRGENGTVIIRDYKTGGKPNPKDMKVENDPQPTFYCLALSAMAKASEEFSERLGWDWEESKTLLGNNPEKRILSNKIIFQYLFVHSDGCEPQETTREDKHYFELTDMIRGVKKRILMKSIYPEWGRKCDYCPVKKECRRRADLEQMERDGISNPEKQQMEFSFAPQIIVNNRKEKRDRDGQKRLKWPKVEKVEKQPLN